MTIVSKNEERLAVALELAEAELWTSISKSYPEATTGDLSPSCAIDLSVALERAVIEWLVFNVDKPASPKIASIMLHRIEYNYRGNDELELTPSDEEHISYCISQGISEGELVTSVIISPKGGTDVYGYWKINNNP